MYLFGTGEPFCVLLGLSSTLPIIIYIYYAANSWLFLIKGETPFDTLERHKHSWVFKILSFSVNSECTSASSWATLYCCFKCYTSSPAALWDWKCPMLTVDHSSCLTELVSNE